MANTLGAYNPIFYANEALIHLRKKLGMAARVHRGYELERNSYRRGDTIRVRTPSTFTAQSAPGSVMNLDTKSLDITLDQWWEVRFELTDKERAFTDDVIIDEHIAPAAYALANKIDQDLAALYKGVPWLYDYGSATDHTIITGTRQVAFNNDVPMDDERLHMMVDGTVEAYFLNSTVFHSAQVAGAAATAPLMRGTLGTRFGVEVFSNQNTPTHTPGTAAAAGGDGAGAVNGVHAVGVTTIAVNSFTGTETLTKGDTFVIAGDTQRYAVNANVSMSGGAANVTITPALAVATSGAEVITVTQQTATAHSQQLFFHRNAFALALAPLPTQIPGSDVFTAVDPVSGLSVRARLYGDGDNSKVVMVLDALYGVKTLNGNLAVRAWT